MEKIPANLHNAGTRRSGAYKEGGVREPLTNIQKIRREKDLSQEEVAHRANIHQTYLSGVETGKRNPSILVVERIAKALGVDVSEIFKPN